MSASKLPPEVQVPVAPTAEVWQTLTARQKEEFTALAMEALSRQTELLPEGQPHARVRRRLESLLRDHFNRARRHVYLASGLPVHYPGEPVFCPDLIAVADVEDPGDGDARMSWVMAEEGRALDLVFEIVDSGDRDRDLVSNVAWYARLGIPEHFVYDRRRQRLYGYRLPQAGERKYEQVLPSAGYLWSEVLGLKLIIIGEKIRFFHRDGAEIPDVHQLLVRANALVDELERRAEAERAELERSAADERAALEARIAELEARLRER